MKDLILIVEDNRVLAQAIAAKAARWGFETVLTPTLVLARNAIAKQKPAVILLDLGLPDGSGLDLLGDFAEGQLPPTAMITAHGELENAITAKKAGVTEFFAKPVDFDALDRFLEGVAKSRSGVATDSEFSASFIGAAKSMRPVFQQIAQACATRRPVLITGAKGTGRSHVAHLIHRNSDDAEALRVVDCRHVTGWEGAMAGQGTFLLDHVAALAMDHQVALTKLLEREGDDRRVLVIANNGGLLEEVRAHRFHPDLYYRLQGVEVALPKLKDRLEDLSALCALFLGELSPKRNIRIGDDAMECLERMPWNGNLSELRQTLRFASLSATGEVLCVEDFPSALRQGGEQVGNEADAITKSIGEWLNELATGADGLPEYREILSEVEGRLLRLLLERFENKPSVMAQSLKLNRSTLRKRLRELGLG